MDIVEWLRREAELVALDRLNEAADKIENQQTALRTAKEYIEAQPRTEVTAHVLAIIDGVLTSPDYVP